MIRMEDMIIEFFQQLPTSVEFLSKFPFLSIIIQKYNKVLLQCHVSCIKILNTVLSHSQTSQDLYRM